MTTQAYQDPATRIYSVHQRSVLIAGASFAGLSAAFWMHRLGYAVTVVEVANTLRKGGTPVDIREGVVPVVRRMGLLERIAAHRLPPRGMQFLDAHGSAVATLSSRPGDSNDSNNADDAAEGYEIERDLLLDMLFGEVKEHVEFIFGDSISALEQSPDDVSVTFTNGARRRFSLVLGCDGTHSAVRRLCFGDESSFSLFLRNYFSLSIVPELLIPENTSQMFNVPGRTVMLSAYNSKTDIAFCFSSEEEFAYDRRDRDGQKRLIQDHFRGLGWKIPALLDAMSGSDDFYFDKLCQIRMPSWTGGRIALVGDAAYCPSPAAGMGGSMAILGAAALADALRSYPDDISAAFGEYDRSFRPTVEQIQADAVEIGLNMFMPSSEAAIEKRNGQLNAG